MNYALKIAMQLATSNKQWAVRWVIPYTDN